MNQTKDYADIGTSVVKLRQSDGSSGLHAIISRACRGKCRPTAATTDKRTYCVSMYNKTEIEISRTTIIQHLQVLLEETDSILQLY